MSYMRGDPYVYSDGTTVHVFGTLTKDQFEDLVVMVHAQVVEEDRVEEVAAYELQEKDHLRDGSEISVQALDKIAYASYRLLVRMSKADEVEQRALDRYAGNGGCDALCRKHGVPTMMDRVHASLRKMEDEDSAP